MKPRAIVAAVAVLLAVGSWLGLVGGAAAQQKIVKIGISMAITGADADSFNAMLNGAQMAIDDVNAKGGAGGYKFEAVVYDSATPTAGQYDPAQAVINYKKFLADNLVVAAVGASSGEGKAISPVLSEADMANITPASTNPDITDPKFMNQYRPRGKAVYFRTVTTDAFQGPYMANYALQTLKMQSVYVLDDGSAFGVGIADTFEKRAKELGIKVLGRERIEPKEPDYRTILTKIRGLNPDAVYYGGIMQAATKLARQAYETIPQIVKLGSDGIFDYAFSEQSGKKAAEGWYATVASPDMLTDPAALDWTNRFKSRFNRDATNYAITAYDAVLVIADAVGRVVESGKPVTRSNVRDAIQATNLTNTLQGPIAFDENGDLKAKVISVYQMKDGKFVYEGRAPEK